MMSNAQKYVLNILKNLPVFKPEHCKPHISEIFLSLSVIFPVLRRIVYVTIQLDYQLIFRTIEINNILSNPLLAAKLLSVQLSVL